MGIEASFLKLANLCATEVVPTCTPCCGMVGDRGMRYPELTAASHMVPSSCAAAAHAAMQRGVRA